MTAGGDWPFIQTSGSAALSVGGAHTGGSCKRAHTVSRRSEERRHAPLGAKEAGGRSMRRGSGGVSSASGLEWRQARQRPQRAAKQVAALECRRDRGYHAQTRQQGKVE
jgi:hypothetical protein